MLVHPPGQAPHASEGAAHRLRPAGDAPVRFNQMHRGLERGAGQLRETAGDIRALGWHGLAAIAHQALPPNRPAAAKETGAVEDQQQPIWAVRYLERARHVPLPLQ